MCDTFDHGTAPFNCAPQLAARYEHEALAERLADLRARERVAGFAEAAPAPIKEAA